MTKLTKDSTPIKRELPIKVAGREVLVFMDAWGVTYRLKGLRTDLLRVSHETALNGITKAIEGK